MLISRNWLQSYFETKLPNTHKIADTLMTHAFEIEEIYKKGDDWIIDIDVLPNRAHDCLSHEGIAREYAALARIEYITDRYHYHNELQYNQKTIPVVIKNDEQCYRYMARMISNIVVGDSSNWLKKRLEAIGQRSINNIVDATNYVMFDCGQPMHAFDADKIVGGITIRNAQDGETMTTLTTEKLTLQKSDLVIADDEGILALAGVKGGTKAEVDTTTKNIIIEVANFNPITTRKTSHRVKIFTDSSKRFENGISSEIAPFAMEAISRLIHDSGHSDETVIGNNVDVYPKTENSRTIHLKLKHVQTLLGCNISIEEITDIFERLKFQHHHHDGVFEIHIPARRCDLTIPEDIIEEIGRVYGYHNIPIASLNDYLFEPNINTGIFMIERLRNSLIEEGFSDVMTYTFVKKGERVMYNPIASDKAALRTSLHPQITESLVLNVRNADYFGLDSIRIFEIGRVYGKDKEEIICTIGIQNVTKSATKKYGSEHAQLKNLLTRLSDIFGISITGEYHNTTVSFPIHELLASSASSFLSRDVFTPISYEENSMYKPISPYPYIVRDVSFWVPDKVSEKFLQELFMNIETLYLVKIFLFDCFEKKGRTSYAFSLIFQSYKATLSNEDILFDINQIRETLENQGYEVR